MQLHKGKHVFKLDLIVLGEVSQVHWHRFNLRIVVLLDVTQNAPILLRNKINGQTFTSETSTATDPELINLNYSHVRFL